MNKNSASDTVRTVLEYHARTKHHFDHYARAPDDLDWSSQPEPFRRYENATLVSLSISEVVPRPPTYDDLYSYNAVASRKVSAGTLAQLFYDSLAISAWKAITGSRWSLRCNPSSGNLHPTEAYLLCGPVDGLCKSPGLFHYTALEHAFERRGNWPDLDWPAWVAEAPSNTFFIGLSSIHWRESWKYGERAYRYCQQDIGHAMAARCQARDHRPQDHQTAAQCRCHGWLQFNG